MCSTASCRRRAIPWCPATRPSGEVIGAGAALRPARPARGSASHGSPGPAAAASSAAADARTSATGPSSTVVTAMAASPRTWWRTPASACRWIRRWTPWPPRPCSAPGSSAFAACAWPATRAPIGIYGFGSAAHIVTQVAAHQGRRVLAFTTPGDAAAQAFAREVGAAWAGGSDLPAPEPLDAALIFAPVGALVPKALRDVKKGGTVVCGGIHMSDIPRFSVRRSLGRAADCAPSPT